MEWGGFIFEKSGKYKIALYAPAGTQRALSYLYLIIKIHKLRNKLRTHFIVVVGNVRGNKLKGLAVYKVQPYFNVGRTIAVPE